jgi:RHS repeat-associated protein
VYLGGQLLAMQAGGVKWVHQDPVVKSQRLTDTYGQIIGAVELDPWGGETTRSWQSQQQSHKFTTYERDADGEDYAQMRSYNSWWSRFSQPDPSDGSYNLTDPQSLNRYSYVQNDPVNFVDPSGLNMETPHGSSRPAPSQHGNGFWSPGIHMTTVWKLSQTSSPPTPDANDSWTVGPAVSFLLAFFVGGDIGTNTGIDVGDGDGRRGVSPPVVSPHQEHNERQRQQERFDDCVRPALNQYRRTYINNTGKAVLAGLSIGVGLSALRGIRLGGVGLGFGGAAHAMKDKSLALGRVGRVIAAGSEASHGSLFGAISLSGGFALTANVYRSDNQAAADLNAKVEECKMRFPGAPHQFITSQVKLGMRTWIAQ